LVIIHEPFLDTLISRRHATFGTGLHRPPCQGSTSTSPAFAGRVPATATVFENPARPVSTSRGQSRNDLPNQTPTQVAWCNSKRFGPFGSLQVRRALQICPSSSAKGRVLSV
jgi:hypothetical protein